MVADNFYCLYYFFSCRSISAGKNTHCLARLLAVNEECFKRDRNTRVWHECNNGVSTVKTQFFTCVAYPLNKIITIFSHVLFATSIFFLFILSFLYLIICCTLAHVWGLALYKYKFCVEHLRAEVLNDSEITEASLIIHLCFFTVMFVLDYDIYNCDA